MASNSDKDQSRRWGAEGHPDALRFWGVLRGLPLHDLRVVHRALLDLVPDAPDDPMREWAAEAIRACAASTGAAHVSRRAYDKWWDPLPDRSIWPSANQIRRVFDNSWTNAAAAAGGEPAPDVNARRLTQRGRACTEQGLICTLRAWAEWMGPKRRVSDFTTDTFKAWARERRRDPAYWHLELPLSHKPWDRCFEGWGDALVQAGISTRGFDPERQRLQPAPFDDLTDDQLIEHLRACARGMGRAPSWDELNKWAEEQESRSEPTPNAHVFNRRFGSLVTALLRADLISEEQAAWRRRRTQTIDPDAGLARLVEALAAHGGNFSRTQYRQWRAACIDRDGYGPDAPPSDSWFDHHFDSFWDAVDKARPLNEGCSDAESYDLSREAA